MELHIETLHQTKDSRIVDADVFGDDLIVLVDQDGPVVYWNERTIRLPFHLSSPFIRLLDSETFLVVDVTHEGTPVNVWVIDGRGSILHSFHAGNAIGAVAVNDTGFGSAMPMKGCSGKGYPPRHSSVSRGQVKCYNAISQILYVHRPLSTANCCKQIEPGSGSVRRFGMT